MTSFAALLFLLSLPFTFVVATPHPERRGACGSIDNAINLRRLYHPTNKDHYYTFNTLAQAQWYWGYNYAIENVNAGLVFNSSLQATSLVPLYRLYQSSTATNLYTASDSFRQRILASGQPAWVDGDFGTLGASPTEVAGFVYPDGSCPGTVPLLWATSWLLTDNLYTIDTVEYDTFVANGYTGMGPIAWVYPVPANRIKTTWS